MKLEPLQQALRSIPQVDDAAPETPEKIEDVLGAAAEFSKLLRKAGIQQTREVREVLSTLQPGAQAEQIREAWQREQQRAAATEQQLRKLAEVMIAAMDILERMLAAMASSGMTDWEAQTRQAIEVCLHNAEKAGLVALGAPGEGFDPAIHDLTREVKHRAGEPLRVSAVVTRGYALNGKVLRRAAVDHVTQ